MMNTEVAGVFEILRTPISGAPPIAALWMGHPGGLAIESWLAWRQIFAKSMMYSFVVSRLCVR